MWIDDLDIDDRRENYATESSFRPGKEALEDGTELTFIAEKIERDMPDFFNKTIPLMSKQLFDVLTDVGASIKAYPVVIKDEDGNRIDKEDYFAVKIIPQFTTFEGVDEPIFFQTSQPELYSGELYVNDAARKAIEASGINTLELWPRAICALAEEFPGLCKYLVPKEAGELFEYSSDHESRQWHRGDLFKEPGSSDYLSDYEVYPPVPIPLKINQEPEEWQDYYDKPLPIISDRLLQLVKQYSGEPIQAFEVEMSTEAPDTYWAVNLSRCSSIPTDDDESVDDLPALFRSSNGGLYIKSECAATVLDAGLNLEIRDSTLFGSEPFIAKEKPAKQQADTKVAPKARAKKAAKVVLKKTTSRPADIVLSVESRDLSLQEKQCEAWISEIDEQLGMKNTISITAAPFSASIVVAPHSDNEVLAAIKTAFSSTGVSDGTIQIDMSDFDPEDVDFEIPSYFSEELDIQNL